MDEVLHAEGINAMFLGLSSDLEYLTGLERNIPTFGNVSYAHGWVGGGFFRPGKEPVCVLPRMFAEVDLPHGAPGAPRGVNETEAGAATSDTAARRPGAVKRRATASR